MRSSNLKTFYTRVVCGSQQQLQLKAFLVQSTILKYRPAIKPHSQRTIDVWIRGVVVQLKDQVATTFASRPSRNITRATAGSVHRPHGERNFSKGPPMDWECLTPYSTTYFVAVSS